MYNTHKQIAIYFFIIYTPYYLILKKMKSKQFILNARVYFSDTDAVGIVYHANYLDFAERARTEFLREEGIDINDLIKQNIYFVLRCANIQYLAPAKIDDLLSIKAYVAKIGNTSLEVMHEITNAETGLKLAEVSTILVCVKKVGEAVAPIPVPEIIKERLFEK